MDPRVMSDCAWGTARPKSRPYLLLETGGPRSCTPTMHGTLLLMEITAIYNTGRV